MAHSNIYSKFMALFQKSYTQPPFLMDNRIKGITITQFDYVIRNINDEELDIHGHAHHYSEFDHNGNLLKEIKYNRYGEFEEMFDYGYDQTGNLIRESYYPEENELAEEKIFSRNDSGLIVQALKNYQDGSIDTTTFLYDDSNQLIEKKTITDEDEVEQIEKFEWENGILINHEILDGDGEPLSEPEEHLARPNQTRITHNELNQVVSEEELDDNGEVFMTVNRSYDEQGRADEVEVFIDGRGKALSRHYFLKYDYTFFE